MDQLGGHIMNLKFTSQGFRGCGLSDYSVS